MRSKSDIILERKLLWSEIKSAELEYKKTQDIITIHENYLSGISLSIRLKLDRLEATSDQLAEMEYAEIKNQGNDSVS